MPVTIRIPTPLRPFTDQRASVEVDGATIGELLNQLATIHSGLRPHLFGADGSLRSFVNVYLNDEDVRLMSWLDTEVSDGDTLLILPAMAGGA